MEKSSTKTGTLKSITANVSCGECCGPCASPVFVFVLLLLCDCSVGGVDMLKIEEMEKMLKEAQLEKARLIDSRVRQGHQATD